MSGAKPPPRIKPQLESPLLRDDPRLAACLKAPAQHILRGASGAHVTRLQLALMAVLPGATLPPAELPDLVRARSAQFGTGTEALVFRFKSEHDPPIVNRAYQNSVDRIVGQMTLSALDDALLRLPAGPDLLQHCLRLIEAISHPHLDLGLRQVMRAEATRRFGA